MTNKTCAERIEEHYNNTLEYIHTASEYFDLDADEEKTIQNTPANTVATKTFSIASISTV